MKLPEGYDWPCGHPLAMTDGDAERATEIMKIAVEAFHAVRNNEELASITDHIIQEAGLTEAEAAGFGSMVSHALGAGLEAMYEIGDIMEVLNQVMGAVVNTPPPSDPREN